MSSSRVSQTPRGEDVFSSDDDGKARKATLIVKNKWEGEDEDEDVLESWDQEEEEKPEPPPEPKPEKSSKKNLKKLGDKFEEKERKKKEELQEKNVEELTPEEKLAEKLRRQKLQEESDLCLAKEVFGVTGKILESKEDFDSLKEDILKVVTDSVKNANYVAFAEDLIQALCVHMSSADIKKIHTKLSNLQIEKAKMEKGDKGKKSKSKAKIKVERDTDYSEFSAYATEEFDDFI